MREASALFSEIAADGPTTDPGHGPCNSNPAEIPSCNRGEVWLAIVVTGPEMAVKRIAILSLERSILD